MCREWFSKKNQHVLKIPEVDDTTEHKLYKGRETLTTSVKKICSKDLDTIFD